jgi:hypothetical protein
MLMNTRKKFWLVWLGAILVMALIAIACGSTTETPTTRPQPTTQPPPASMAGRWNDPDTPGTVTTIEERNGEFEVVSVINPDRGVNELTWTTYENGVLSWEYCPESMYCITSETVSVTSSTLTATWNWTDGGNGGTTYFERLP